MGTFLLLLLLQDDGSSDPPAFSARATQAGIRPAIHSAIRPAV